MQPASHGHPHLAQAERLIQLLPTAIYTSDAEGRLTACNPAAVELWGASPEIGTVLAHGPWEFFRPDGKPMPAAEHPLVRAIAEKRSLRDVEVAFIRGDGRRLTVLSSPTPLFGDDGELTGVVNVLVDITARKTAEQELRASETRFRSLFALASDWYWEQDEQLRFTTFSPTVVHLAGSSVESHIGKTRWELPTVGVAPEDWADHRGRLERHEPFRDFEYCRVNEKGELIYVRVSGDPVFDDQGRFKGYRGVGKNITASRRIEQELRASESRYRTALKVGRMASWETDFATGRRYWSPEGIELLGLPLKGPWGVVGGPDDELRAAMHPDDRHLLDHYHARVEEQDEIDAQYRIVLPNGTVRYFAGRGQIVARRPDGRPWKLVNIVADVTERALAEERSFERARELEEAKAKYQALVRAAAQIEWSAAPDGTIFEDSPTWRAFTGQTLEQWIGRGWLDAVHPADRQRAEEAWREAVAGGERYDVAYRVRHNSGEYRWTRARGVPLVDRTGGIIEWVGVNEDITEDRQREEHLEVVMRELSHRTKNLLSVIQAIARRTLSKANGDDVRAFTERLHGIARSHDLLVRGSWRGASLYDLVTTHLEPFGPINPARVRIGGAPVSLQPSAAQSVGLAIHELATNAAKYGALAALGGDLDISWSIVSDAREPSFSLVWHERPATPPSRSGPGGFGRQLLERIAASSIGGKSGYDIGENGITWTLIAPLQADVASPSPDAPPAFS